MNTALVLGFSNQENKMLWDCGFVKSSCKIDASGLAGRSLSMARQFTKPNCLKQAVTPAVPQNTSRIIALSTLMAVTSGCGRETCCCVCHSAFGISALCTSQNLWGLKHPSLKHACRPLSQLPPAGALSHVPKFQLKHSGRLRLSLPTHPL